MAAFRPFALEYLIAVHIKRSHSIHILSIQIDTKSLDFSSTTSNCPFLQAKWNGVFHYVRLLETLE